MDKNIERGSTCSLSDVKDETLPIGENEYAIGISFDEMSGGNLTLSEVTDWNGKTMMDVLNGEVTKEGSLKFGEVTVTGSNTASGKYSFPTDKRLTGMDYPFPTILQQTVADKTTDKVNVHYGDWPLSGIEREDGNVPIALDIFGDGGSTGTGDEDSGGSGSGGGTLSESSETIDAATGGQALQTKEVKLHLSDLLKQAIQNDSGTSDKKGELSVSVAYADGSEKKNNETESEPDETSESEPKNQAVRAKFKMESIKNR